MPSTRDTESLNTCGLSLGIAESHTEVNSILSRRMDVSLYRLLVSRCLRSHQLRGGIVCNRHNISCLCFYAALSYLVVFPL
jgi:hypothetical protein